MRKREGPIRVLVVDDSMVVREILKEILTGEADMVVVGEAVNGRDAVDKTVALAPDLVTLDIRMPVLDGLDAVTEIMAVKPTPILVITASLSKDEMDVSFEAIHRGALDVMLKPQATTKNEYHKIGAILVDKVRMLSNIRVIPHFNRKARKTRSIPSGKARERSGLLVIGSSIGGPPAVMSVLKSLTPNFPMPIAIVQHITNGFTEGFATWLGKNIPFQVVIGKEGDRLAQGKVLVAPDACHMEVDGVKIKLSDAPPMNSCKPSVDALFLTAAETYRDSLTAVVLTGMGHDGAAGAQKVKERGGHVIVQDKESCVVFGMPQAVILRNAADEVLPLADIPEALVSRVLGK